MSQKAVKKIFGSQEVAKFVRNFGYDVADISEYVKMDAPEIISEMVEASTLLDKITFKQDIKNKGIVKVMRGDIPLGAWSGCSISDGGTLDFQEVEIETKKLGFSIDFCSEDLVDKWSSLMLNSGAKNELKNLPAESQVQALFLALLKNRIEDILINGDTASPNANLLHFDGIAKIITDSASVGGAEDAVTVTGTAITSSNAYANFKSVARAFPTAVQESSMTLGIWCNATDFDKLVDNLEADNNFHYSGQVEGKGGARTLVLPSTGVKVEIKKGLASNEIYGVVYELIAGGTDADSDMATIDIEYLTEARKVRTDAAMYIGVNLVEKKNFVKFVTA